MFKRISSLLLAVLLIFSTISFMPVKADAEELVKTYTFNDLSKENEYGLTSEVTSGGALSVTFEDQYKSIFYAIPSDVDPRTIEKVTFDVTKGSVSALAFKLHTQEDFDSTNKEGTPVVFGQKEIKPTGKGMVKYFSIMSLNTGKTEAEISSVTFYLSGEGNPEEAYAEEENVIEGENLIKNGNFDDADCSMWTAESGNAVVSVGEAEEPIFGDVKTYGIINGRERSYDCIAQDITDVVSDGRTYAYSFYAMLSADYDGAPGEQRQVDFAPYITAGGETNYLGSYSPEISGSCSKQLNPGVWTKFEGTFKVAAANEIEKVVIRLLEQGTNYGEGDCVKGEYYVTGVSLIDLNLETAKIEENVPNLKDTFTADFGDDIIAGVSIVNSELNDKVLMQLVTKHFNSVTLGNELKPDAMFNYSNSKCPGTEEVELNGEKITVPVMNFQRAESMLDYIYDWNKENPDSQIKVRGHVLVWHSQTPEWFFHEDYDKTKPYVSSEEMNKRLEWYIKSVLEHFTGEDSKYKDLFYGWDVVNEAISDSTNTYRTETESGTDALTDDTHGSKSSWWAVYQSNEFIINAFKYANKYAPASLELYYNDYNDCTGGKVEGIVELLKAVKEAEGTRIDGMGMQGHYDMSYPTVSQFESSAKAYSEVVGKIMLTELDFKASSDYDGTEATRADEYNRQAYRYKDIYTSLKKLKEEGVDVRGMVIWGVIDGNSWLQSYAGVGGGADGTQTQCPLLFDDDYHVKPAFWGIVDSTKLEPAVNTVTVNQGIGESFASGMEYSFTEEDTTVSFVPVWKDGVFKVKVKVNDTVNDATDKVTLFFDKYDSRTSGITTHSEEVLRADATETADGYEVIITNEADTLKVGSSVGFDIVVTNGDKTYAFNDKSGSYANSSKYYAKGELKPFVTISMGTPVIDGEADEVWNDASEISLGIITDNPEASGSAKVLWDNDNLYVFATVKDAVLNKDSENAHEQDSVEIFIDETNTKAEEYNDSTKQYRINYVNEASFNGDKCLPEYCTSFAKETGDGYVVEAAIKWSEITPEIGNLIGFEFQINDGDSSGMRIGNINWCDATNLCWSTPKCFGTAQLVEHPGDVIEVVTSASGSSGSKLPAILILLGGYVITAAGVCLVLFGKKKENK